jgi:hypothetical protein
MSLAKFVADRNNSGNAQLTEINSILSQGFVHARSGRVTDIILDETHPKFNTFGGWSSIGSIFYEQIDTPKKSTQQNPVARPLFPQFQTPPLVNELVLLFYLPDKNLGKNDASKSWYYINSISIWNSIHQNAYPNVFKYANREKNTSKDYNQIEQGAAVNTENKSPELDLNGPNNTGGTFIERSNRNNLMPFSGDNIIEGRFGSSIRLGSTIKSKSQYQNNWSKEGESGDPILILRNGQNDNDKKGFLPTVEKIQDDPSSIYLTSTQQIPFEPASKNYTALQNTPIEPGDYNGSPQIILNSGRLILNSKVDSILLSAQKSINLSSIEDIGIASDKDVSIEADNIFLGGKLSNQPAINGQYFNTQLGFLLIAMRGLVNALNNDPKVSPFTKQMANLALDPIDKFSEKVKNGDFLSKKVKL